MVKLFHLYKAVIATGWLYIAPGQLYIATGQLYVASGQLYDLMSDKYITVTLGLSGGNQERLRLRSVVSQPVLSLLLKVHDSFTRKQYLEVDLDLYCVTYTENLFENINIAD